jgi:lipopolysaccharide biosynthesis regulator YciM
MNFAYLDARSLLETVMGPPAPEPVQAIPCDLRTEWTEFGEELGKFKSEFTKTRAELTVNLAALNEKHEEMNVLRMLIDNVNSRDLKEKLEDILSKHESEEGISTLTQQCGELKGKMEAMKKVLMDTHAERYGKFTCFVCMDRLVDLFIEPCGHVICDACWVRTTNKVQCPGCRVRMEGVKKIFTMN